MFLSSLVFIGSRFRAGWNHVHAIGRTPVWTVGLRQDHTRVILASPETEHGPGAARDHRRGTRPFRHASHLEAHAHLPRPSSRRPGLFHARGHDGHARHRQPTAPRKNRGPFISRAPSVQTRRCFRDGRLTREHWPVPQGHRRKERGVNEIILHGIPQSCRAKSLPINEIDMGVASDVNVYTFTRFAPRIGLLGRPRPHGRASSPDRFAASRTCRPHTSTGGAK